MTPGQAAYERELAAQPTYPDGTPRQQWSQLKPWAQQSWERDPTARIVTEDALEAPKPLPPGLLELEALRRLPDDVMAVDEQCLYFLWGGDELLYIGASLQVSERISRHTRDRNHRSAINGRPVPFDRHTFLEVASRRELWRLETAYQMHYDPPCNTVSYRRRSY